MNVVLKAKSLTPRPLWRVLKWGKRRAIRTLQTTCGLVGLNVAKKSDYYSPLPVYDDLLKTQRQWNQPSALVGVEFNLDQMKTRLASLFARFGGEISALPSYAQNVAEGFGPGYPCVDALTLYAMLRELKPKRYLEVGSGLSTFYCSLAAQVNRTEGHPLAIQCIEPYPYDKLRSLAGIHVSAQLVQEVELSVFKQLEAGDVLFIDSSHALKIGSDVAFLLLEVLPILQPGVYVHIHDISFPYNFPYPAEHWIIEQNWPMYWNEAMVVQTFLCFNHAFEVFLSCPLIRYCDEAFLEQTIPGYQKVGGDVDTFSSLWIRRR